MEKRGRVPALTNLIVVSLLCLLAQSRRMQHRARPSEAEKLNVPLRGGHPAYPRRLLRGDTTATQGAGVRLCEQSSATSAGAAGVVAAAPNATALKPHGAPGRPGTPVLASVREQTTLRGDTRRLPRWRYRVFRRRTSAVAAIRPKGASRAAKRPRGVPRLYVIVMWTSPTRQTRQASKSARNATHLTRSFPKRIISKHDLSGGRRASCRRASGFQVRLLTRRFDPATGTLSETCVYEGGRGIYRNLVSSSCPGAARPRRCASCASPRDHLWCQVSGPDHPQTRRADRVRVSWAAKITDIDREAQHGTPCASGRSAILTGLYNAASAVGRSIQSELESPVRTGTGTLLVLDEPLPGNQQRHLRASGRGPRPAQKWRSSATLRAAAARDARTHRRRRIRGPAARRCPRPRTSLGASSIHATSCPSPCRLRARRVSNQPLAPCGFRTTAKPTLTCSAARHSRQQRTPTRSALSPEGPACFRGTAAVRRPDGRLRPRRAQSGNRLPGPDPARLPDRRIPRRAPREAPGCPCPSVRPSCGAPHGEGATSFSRRFRACRARRPHGERAAALPRRTRCPHGPRVRTSGGPARAAMPGGPPPARATLIIQDRANIFDRTGNAALYRNEGASAFGRLSEAPEERRWRIRSCFTETSR